MRNDVSVKLKFLEENKVGECIFWNSQHLDNVFVKFYTLIIYKIKLVKLKLSTLANNRLYRFFYTYRANCSSYSLKYDANVSLKETYYAITYYSM